MIPSHLYTKLSVRNCLRENDAGAKSALEKLPVSPKEDFVEFFERFNGPIGSEGMGYQLLDINEDDPSVITATEQIRLQFGMPEQYLAISDLLAGGVLIYDCSNDAVYDVDFEGAFDLLLAGQLKPRWGSFVEFLVDYFEL